jgi:four helix bundle protein
MRPYQKLFAWQKAHELTLDICEVTKKFPSDERFGLTTQIQRAAASVELNIAEGNTKRTAKDKAKFFTIALASLNEVDCAALIAKDLGYLSFEPYQRIVDRITITSIPLTKLNNLFLSKRRFTSKSRNPELLIS